MATVEDAVKAKVLELYELPDWELRLPIRLLWCTFVLWDWIDGKDELHDVALGVGRRTLCEHIEQMLCDFRCSPRFSAGDLRQIMPTKNGIRKMHPPRLRIYGWCPAPHAFVAVTAALESDTKTDKKLNDKKREEVLTFIKVNKLGHLVLKGDNLAVFPPPTR
jgi:hypothetical protein